MTAPIECVCVHAWRYYDDENQEYCDDDEQPDGWCAYERTVTNEGGEFDHGEECDFPTLEAALAWAEQRAALHRVPVHIY